MLLSVPKKDKVYCFVEEISVSKDMESSLKLTKNTDVAERHDTMIINSKDLIRGKSRIVEEVFFYSKQRNMR